MWDSVVLGGSRGEKMFVERAAPLCGGGGGLRALVVFVVQDSFDRSVFQCSSLPVCSSCRFHLRTVCTHFSTPYLV